jgi:ABC-type sugar transport system substrate-binding protein
MIIGRRSNKIQSARHSPRPAAAATPRGRQLRQHGQLASDEVAMISTPRGRRGLFDVINKGAQAVADKTTSSSRTPAPTRSPRSRCSSRTPIDSKVDGIAVSMPDPDALALVFQKAVAAGIPGGAFNAGDRGVAEDRGT